MRFPPEFLDELRARLPVSEVVGRRVKLKKAGREWRGLSPFNQEKTPSFFVNDQKQAWFDFSSGKNGSIFDFVILAILFVIFDRIYPTRKADLAPSDPGRGEADSLLRPTQG